VAAGRASVSVEWSVADYVGRVIVQTARDTGRSVREVAGESFALTLWTWAELQRMAREEMVERMGERTDLAGLVAVAFHEPQKLQQAEMRYLSAAGRLSQMLDETRDRLSSLAERMQTAAQRHEQQAAGG